MDLPLTVNLALETLARVLQVSKDEKLLVRAASAILRYHQALSRAKAQPAAKAAAEAPVATTQPYANPTPADKLPTPRRRPSPAESLLNAVARLECEVDAAINPISPAHAQPSAAVAPTPGTPTYSRQPTVTGRPQHTQQAQPIPAASVRPAMG